MILTPLYSFPQTEVKKHLMKAAIKSGIERGELVTVKASLKLSADAKKKMTKSDTAKKEAPKKAAPKKKKVRVVFRLQTTPIQVYSCIVGCVDAQTTTAKKVGLGLVSNDNAEFHLPLLLK